MKTLISYLFKFKLLFILRCFTVILSSLSSIIFAIMLGDIIDTFTSSNLTEFNSLAIKSIFIIVFIFTITLLDSIISKIYTKKIIINLKSDIFNKILSKDIVEFNKNNTGNYISILNNDIQLIESGLYEGFFLFIFYISSFLLTLIVISSKSIFLTIIILSLSSLTFFLPKIISDRIAIKKHIFLKDSENMTSFTKDLFSAFEIIKAFNIFGKVKQLFFNKVIENESKKTNYKLGESLINSIIQSSTFLVFISTLFICGILIYKSKLSVGDSLIIVQLTNNLIQPVTIIISIISGINSLKLIALKLEKILNIENQSQLLNYENFTEFNDNISINNLSFSYDSKKLIIDNFTFKFLKGKKYAIVGKSGCGKSTLVKILMKYFENYDGTVEIDSYDLKSISPKDLYKQITMIHQNIVMFDDTVKNNITLFKDFSTSEIENSISLSGLKNFINSCNLNLETLVGENGNKLSGGEKQRIAIARAIINNSKIIILDEATSSLDNETSHTIENSLLDIKDLTLINVTHKLSEESLKNYDQILVLKDGHIEEYGNFDVLLSNKGYFYSMYTLDKCSSVSIQ